MCRSFKVTGRVQGVFFRDSTRDAAKSLNLAGHAINLPDGSVEVRACGSDDDIDRLAEWLRTGPRLASVENVETIDVRCSRPLGFKTG
jgi:acylphosphatase